MATATKELKSHTYFAIFNNIDRIDPTSLQHKAAFSEAEPMRRLKILSHRRRPVSTAEVGPGLRREDKEGALNHPNAIVIADRDH
jgi:hypothetical protein